LPGGNWPSTYFNFETGHLLIVYVDDMKLAGPAGAPMAKIWEKLGTRLNLEEPRGDQDPNIHTFLGCIHTRTERKVNGKTVQCMEYDVKASMRKCLAKYDEAVYQATGSYPKMRHAKTPFLVNEETKTSKLRAPEHPTEAFVECPGCLHSWSVADNEEHCTFSAGTRRPISKILAPITKEALANKADDSGESAAESTCSGGSMLSGPRAHSGPESEDSSWEDKEDVSGNNWWSGLAANCIVPSDSRSPRGGVTTPRKLYCTSAQPRKLPKTKSPTKSDAPSDSGPSDAERSFNPGVADRDDKEGDKGQLGEMAAMMLMTILYSARQSRFDLFKAINFLAKRITRWDPKCDRRLHQLMCFIWSSREDQMIGWIGDDPKDLTGHLFCDADFAGCPYTLRSTSGCHADLQGPNSRFPWGAGANQQTAMAQSTPEAELSSLNKGMQEKGEPALDIWQVLLGRYHDPGWKFRMNLHEDNTPCIHIAGTGVNKTMKTLERNFGCKIGWIHERIRDGYYNLIHTRTKDMTADIYTKGFTDAVLWTRLRRLCNIYTPE
jgi:hypothetical protein